MSAERKETKEKVPIAISKHGKPTEIGHRCYGVLSVEWVVYRFDVKPCHGWGETQVILYVTLTSRPS